MSAPASRLPAGAQGAGSGLGGGDACSRPAPADLYRGELVGLHARIVRSCNPNIVGASGRVVEETKNMLVLLPPAPPQSEPPRQSSSSPSSSPSIPSPPPPLRRARVRPPAGACPRRLLRPYRSYPKAGSVWRFEAAAAGRHGAAAAHAASAEIDGSLIARRPEDRLRAKLPPSLRTAAAPRPAGHARAAQGGPSA